MTPALHATHRSHAHLHALRARAAAGTSEARHEVSSGHGSAAPAAADAETSAQGSPVRPWLAPSGSGARPPEAGTASPGAAADPQLEAVMQEVRGNLGELAADPDAFHEALGKAFGERYDKAAAETIRQQTLAGDFSWMPEIKLVDAATLTESSGGQGAGAQGLGAYSAETDTVYISRDLVASDPAKAASVLTEEIGHGLDTRINAGDAAGDEGEIFSRLVEGDTLSDTELASMKAENDKGTIVVDGKEVEVEFFIGKVFKGIGKAIKGAFKAVMESELLGQIMMIAQFIPIPIVQVAARAYQLVKAAYMVGKGISEGSVAMILSGAASGFSAAGQLGGTLGASTKFVDKMNTFSNYARIGSQGYAAAAERDIGAGLSLAAGALAGTDAAPRT